MQIEELAIMALLLNTIVDLAISLIMLGVLLHIFLVDRVHRLRIEKMLTEAECICAKLDKIYASIF